jgi:hypothetical protein
MNLAVNSGQVRRDRLVWGSRRLLSMAAGRRQRGLQAKPVGGHCGPSRRAERTIAGDGPALGFQGGPGMADYLKYLGYSDPHLARVDPLMLDLEVAKSIPALAHLETAKYQHQADEWADGITKWLPRVEPAYWKSPEEWNNDINLFRLGLVCEYLDRNVGISYIDDQRDVKNISYTNAADLFLCGVMDTKRGTCGNMATLYVAMVWRLGWPVSLACAGAHLFCRFDDGNVTYNIETSYIGAGPGWKKPPDSWYIEQYDLSPKAVSTGSDLRALTPRERLAIFISHRARHMNDTGKYREAERDYLLARHLFPGSRDLYRNAMGTSVRCSVDMFDGDEVGTPLSLARMILSEYAYLPHRGGEFPTAEAQAGRPAMVIYSSDPEAVT